MASGTLLHDQDLVLTILGCPRGLIMVELSVLLPSTGGLCLPQCLLSMLDQVCFSPAKIYFLALWTNVARL